MWETLAARGGPLGLATFVVTLVVVSLIRGWLIPLSTHLRELGYREETIKDQKATIAELKHQRDVLLGQAAMTPPAREPAA